MPKGLIVMTALPPTKGHVQMIRWAAHYLLSCGSAYESELRVKVFNTKEDEPLDPFTRAYWLADACGNLPVYTSFMGYDTDLPDIPGDDPEFWGKWQSFIFRTAGPFKETDIVFSSERYGEALAKVLGCRWIPYDLHRETIPFSATAIRENPIYRFSDMALPAQHFFRKTVTVFGAESTGKTTLAKRLAKMLGSVYTPEWARPYLESLPSPETTDERMEIIVNGQRATEQAAFKINNTPMVIRDTDLLSTVGYYGVYSKHTPTIGVNKADLYIVCPSNIPFAPDPLRYGVDRRETTDRYWTKLLDRYECNYHVLQAADIQERQDEAMEVITDFFRNSHPLWSYKRKIE